MLVKIYVAGKKFVKLPVKLKNFGQICEVLNLEKKLVGLHCCFLLKNLEIASQIWKKKIVNLIL